MENHLTGASTVLHWSDFRFRTNLDDGEFTQTVTSTRTLMRFVGAISRHRADDRCKCRSADPSFLRRPEPAGAMVSAIAGLFGSTLEHRWAGPRTHALRRSRAKHQLHPYPALSIRQRRFAAHPCGPPRGLRVDAMESGERASGSFGSGFDRVFLGSGRGSQPRGHRQPGRPGRATARPTQARPAHGAPDSPRATGESAKLFLLPYHRKRTFPGRSGRHRSERLIDEDARYESGAKAAPRGSCRPLQPTRWACSISA